MKFKAIFLSRPVGIAFAILFFATVSSSLHAVTKDQVIIFGKTVACSQLPVGTCEFLNAENARNLRRALAAALTQRYCGSMNFSAAKGMLDIGEAPDPEKCRKILSLRSSF